MFSSNIWKLHKEKIEKTETTFVVLSDLCFHVLESMYDMTKILTNNVLTMRKKSLPYYQQFIITYFIRNIKYLESAYFLACGSLCGPSRNLQRTIYETILRGYLFIVDNKQADLMYSCVNHTISKDKLKALRKRKFWPFYNLINILYTPNMKKQHKKFFNKMSYFSHPSIRGVYNDVKYSKTEVKDCLSIILYLEYGNIQMMTEGFFNFLNPVLNRNVKVSLLEIVDYLDKRPIFEPNKLKWSSKIKLKKGNFHTILK